MGDIQPYNEIGQILAAGGEQAVGLAYSAGFNSGYIDAMILRRWGISSGGGFLLLKALGKKGAEAAEMMDTLAPGDNVPIDEMPINPKMPGGGEGGNRFRWIAEVTFQESGQSIIVRGWGNGSESVEDLYGAAFDTASDIGTRYPGKFGLTSGEDPSAANVRFLFQGKAF
jgi:hypothetical protein